MGLFYPSFVQISNNPKGRVPRALPVGEWMLAHRASSIACVLERVPRALPVGIYRILEIRNRPCPMEVEFFAGARIKTNHMK